ncbi:MAG: trypsin-like serine protease [Myxococcales bacterium]|nr:trypsin-like serine protease [Myxococcales bacterium]
MTGRLSANARWLLAALAFAAGCGPSAELSLEPPGSSRREIVGGQVDSADPEVFMIEFKVFGVPSMCSATLIGRRTLLTAAHCVDSSLFPGAGQLSFRATNQTQAKMAAAADYTEVTEVRIHSGWGGGNAANDIALMLLKSEPAGASGKPWNTANLSGLAGQPLRVVGYGYTDPDDYNSWGTKHSVDLSMRAISSAFITTGDRTSRGFCSGDSGGPSFHTFPDGVERLVGVHSNGPTCYDGDDVRVDAHASFLQAWLNEKEALAAPCGKDGQCDQGCATDPDCSAEWSPCLSELGCRSRLCVPHPQGGGFCSRPCAASADCPPAMACLAGACGFPPAAEEAPAQPPSAATPPQEEARPGPIPSLRDTPSCASAGTGRFPTILWPVLLGASFGLRRRFRR